MAETQLTIATPFAGYESPYLEMWTEAYALMVEGTGATGLWLDNSSMEDVQFTRTLRRYAKKMPIKVKVLPEPLRVGNVQTSAGKNIQVCVLWQRIAYEVRDPDAWLLCVESDVLVPAGAAHRLRERMEAHPALGAVSGAIPAPLGDGDICMQAWRINMNSPGPQSRYAPPAWGGGGNGFSFDWCAPDRTGVELVDATGFGCLMVQVRNLYETPLQAMMFPPLGYDQEWGLASWAAGRPVAIDWSVRCGHLRKGKGGEYGDIRAQLPDEDLREARVL